MDFKTELKNAIAAGVAKGLEKGGFASMAKKVLRGSWAPTEEERKKAAKEKEEEGHITFTESIGNVFKGITTMFKVALAPMNLLMSVLDAFGALEPILEIFNAVIQIIGANIMIHLVPALQRMIDTLLSPEMIDVYEEVGRILGDVIGEFFIMLMNILSTPTFKRLMVNFVRMMSDIGETLINIIWGIGKFIASLNVAQLRNALVLLAGGITFLYVFGQMAAWNAAAAATIALVAAAAVVGTMAALLMPMQYGGIVTRPTMALIGERGPEAVIPLSEAGKSGAGVGGDVINLTLEGGVYATNIDDLARQIAKQIKWQKYSGW